METSGRKAMLAFAASFVVVLIGVLALASLQYNRGADVAVATAPPPTTAITQVTPTTPPPAPALESQPVSVPPPSDPPEEEDGVESSGHSGGQLSASKILDRMEHRSHIQRSIPEPQKDKPVIKHLIPDLIGKTFSQVRAAIGQDPVDEFRPFSDNSERYKTGFGDTIRVIYQHADIPIGWERTPYQCWSAQCDINGAVTVEEALPSHILNSPKAFYAHATMFTTKNDIESYTEADRKEFIIVIKPSRTGEWQLDVEVSNASDIQYSFSTLDDITGKRRLTVSLDRQNWRSALVKRIKYFRQVSYLQRITDNLVMQLR